MFLRHFRCFSNDWVKLPLDDLSILTKPTYYWLLPITCECVYPLFTPLLSCTAGCFRGIDTDQLRTPDNMTLAASLGHFSTAQICGTPWLWTFNTQLPCLYKFRSFTILKLNCIISFPPLAPLNSFYSSSSHSHGFTPPCRHQRLLGFVLLPRLSRPGYIHFSVSFFEKAVVWLNSILVFPPPTLSDGFYSFSSHLHGLPLPLPPSAAVRLCLVVSVSSRVYPLLSVFV